MLDKVLLLRLFCLIYIFYSRLEDGVSSCRMGLRDGYLVCFGYTACSRYLGYMDVLVCMAWTGWLHELLGQEKSHSNVFVSFSQFALCHAL